MSEKGSKKIILMVDDADTVLMYQKLMLLETGYRLITANDGQTALELAEKMNPDLILLDIQMPILNGVDTCRKLKEQAHTQNIPVLMVTTQGEPEMMEQAFEAGADDYITKPVEKLELLSRVKTFLQ